MKLTTLIAAALVVALTFMVGADPAFAMVGAASAHAPLGLLAAGGAAAGWRIPMTAMERVRGRYLRDGQGHNGAGDGRRELSPEEAAREVKTAFEVKTNEVKAIAEKALAEAERGIPMSETAKQLADQAITGMNEAKARIDELEQKMARGGGEDDAEMTAGERFVNADEFKAFAGQTRPRGRVIVEVKDISSLTTDAAGSVGALVTQATRVSAPPLPQRRMTIRALLAPGNTNSNLIEYDREKGFTNNADVVAEGALKAQSDIQYEDASAPVRTIAHWMRASVQILADAPGLRSIIDQRLRYGLAYKEEIELLTGSGSGQHLSGLITNSTPYAASFAVAGETQIDKLRLAMLQVALAEYAANGHVLNPIDWAVIETLKDGEGRYLIGNPQGGVEARLWGLPVVATQAMTVDKFLTGAFDLAAQIFDRQDATVEVSTEDQDNFVKNKVTIRAEERLALAIYRPEALIYGDLGRV